MTPDDIAEKIATGQINIGAERKETTTAAGQAGKVAVAVEELGTFGDQVLAASGAIPRGQFIPINKLIQMTDAQLSDPALINLKVKMQSLNNAYDQLAARGGTDAEKRAHIAQLFNTAASPEGVAALVSAIKDEAKAAQEAARKATQRRPHETSQAPGPGTGASDVPDDIAALLAKHGAGMATRARYLRGHSQRRQGGRLGRRAQARRLPEDAAGRDCGAHRSGHRCRPGRACQARSSSSRTISPIRSPRCAPSSESASAVGDVVKGAATSRPPWARRPS
jgi:hypothetical protein